MGWFNKNATIRELRRRIAALEAKLEDKRIAYNAYAEVNGRLIVEVTTLRNANAALRAHIKENCECRPAVVGDEGAGTNGTKH